MSHITLEELNNLIALEQQATPGPWINGERIEECIEVETDHADIYRETPDGNANVACATFDAKDAEFVVALRNAAPNLLSELKEAYESLAIYRKEVSELRGFAELSKVPS